MNEMSQRKYELLFRPAVLIQVKEYEDGTFEVSEYPTLELDPESDFVQVQMLDHPYENLCQEDWQQVHEEVRKQTERLIATLAVRMHYRPLDEDEPF